MPNIATTVKVSTELKTHVGKNGDLPENKDYRCKDIHISVHLEEQATKIKNSKELALP